MHCIHLQTWSITLEYDILGDPSSHAHVQLLHEATPLILQNNIKHNSYFMQFCRSTPRRCCVACNHGNVIKRGYFCIARSFVSVYRLCPQKSFSCWRHMCSLFEFRLRRKRVIRWLLLGLLSWYSIIFALRLTTEWIMEYDFLSDADDRLSHTQILPI